MFFKLFVICSCNSKLFPGIVCLFYCYGEFFKKMVNKQLNLEVVIFG